MLRPTPADTTQPTSNWNSSVGQAIEQLKEQIANASGLDENLRLSQEISLRLLSLADRKLEVAMEPIPGLTSNEQDYFRHQLQALYEAGNPDAMPVKSRRWSLVMNSQRTATQKLAAASNLEVRSLAFCTDVQGYGVMTKFPAYTFKPDQELLLYCELENVLAEAVKGGFETQLQGTYELLDDNGRRVADQLLPMEREICQNHRRDYFIIYHIYMPAQIEPGKYQMRVTIEDMKARKFGQATVDFQVQP
jgi:ParB-like chromosome segregation protein Spo0J